MIDALALTQALIRCPSVTPADAGALAVLEEALKPLGFECHRLRFEQAGTAPIENLYARIGKGAPHFLDITLPATILRLRTQHGERSAYLMRSIGQETPPGLQHFRQTRDVIIDRINQR